MCRDRRVRRRKGPAPRPKLPWPGGGAGRKAVRSAHLTENRQEKEKTVVAPATSDEERIGRKSFFFACIFYFFTLGYAHHASPRPARRRGACAMPPPGESGVGSRTMNCRRARRHVMKKRNRVDSWRVFFFCTFRVRVFVLRGKRISRFFAFGRVLGTDQYIFSHGTLVFLVLRAYALGVNAQTLLPIFRAAHDSVLWRGGRSLLLAVSLSLPLGFLETVPPSAWFNRAKTP